MSRNLLLTIIGSDSIIILIKIKGDNYEDNKHGFT